MRKLFAVLALILSTLSVFGNADVLVDLGKLNMSTVANRRVTITPLSAPTVIGATTVIGDTIDFITDGTGSFTITNTAKGLYELKVWAPPTTTILRFFVKTNDTGTVSINRLLVAASTATYPSASVAYSVDASDARYAIKGQAGIAVAQGTNIVMTTNIDGTLVTINAKTDTNIVNILAANSGTKVTVGLGLVGSTGPGNLVTISNPNSITNNNAAMPNLNGGLSIANSTTRFDPDGSGVFSGLVTAQGLSLGGENILLNTDGSAFFSGAVQGLSFTGDGSGLTGLTIPHIVDFTNDVLAVVTGSYIPTASGLATNLTQYSLLSIRGQSSVHGEIKIFNVNADKFIDIDGGGGSSTPKITTPALNLSGLTASTILGLNLAKDAQSVTMGNGLAYNAAGASLALANNINVAGTLDSTGTFTAHGNVNVTGTVNLSSLSASLPVATDGSKNLISAAMGYGVAYSGGIFSLGLTNLAMLDSRQYGAVGDGTADDTTALQAMIDAAEKSPGWAHIVKGVYKITSTLRIGSNVRLTLDQNATIKRSANIDSMLLSKSDGTIGVYGNVTNVIVEGGCFDGNKVNFSDTSTLIAFGHGTDITVRNVRLINGPGSWHFIEYNAIRHGRISDCTFSNSATSESIQLDIAADVSAWPWYGPYDNTECSEIAIEHNHFENVQEGIGSHRWAANHMHNRIYVVGNTFTNFTGVAVRPYDWSGGIVIADNFADNGYRFLDADLDQTAADPGFVRYDWKITGNRIANMTKDSAQSRGIKIKWAQNVLIANNTITNISRHGIGVDWASRNVTIANNIISDCGQLASTGRGIFIFGTPSVTISGNIITNTFDAPITLGNSTAGNTATNITCIGNSVAGNIELNTISNSIVFGNRCTAVDIQSGASQNFVDANGILSSNSYSGFFSGTFVGDGSGLTGLPGSNPGILTNGDLRTLTFKGPITDTNDLMVGGKVIVTNDLVTLGNLGVTGRQTNLNLTASRLMKTDAFKVTTTEATITATEAGSLVNHSDVSVTSLAAGQALVYNGSVWANATPAGGVTSVGLLAPPEFNVSGSPVTGSGTLTISKVSQSPHTVYAGPTVASGTPTFRLLSASDIPDVSASYWNTAGNGSSSGFFLGTTDDNPLTLKVHGFQAAKYFPVPTGVPANGVNVLEGGLNNTFGAANIWSAVIVGGENDTIASTFANRGSVILGGNHNTVDGFSSSSVAGGQYAHSFHDHCFVWSDSQGDATHELETAVADQFLVRARGGIGLYAGAGNVSLTNTALNLKDSGLIANVLKITTASYTIVSTNYEVLVDTGVAGDSTVTLPSSPVDGERHSIICYGSGGHTLTLASGVVGRNINGKAASGSTTVSTATQFDGWRVTYISSLNMWLVEP